MDKHSLGDWTRLHMYAVCSEVPDTQESSKNIFLFISGCYESWPKCTRYNGSYLVFRALHKRVCKYSTRNVLTRVFLRNAGQHLILFLLYPLYSQQRAGHTLWTVQSLLA